jgi:CBS domain-containing protein
MAMIATRDNGPKNDMRIGSWPGLVRRSGLVCVLEQDRIGDVAEIMARSNIGAVLVLRNDGILAGIFTERDLLRRIGTGKEVDMDAEIGGLMTPDPWGVSLDAGARFLAREMLARGFRHAVVFDDARVPVGIVSMRDLLAILLEA